MRQFFLIVFGLYAVANIYICYRGWQALGNLSWGIKSGYAVLYAILALLAWQAFRSGNSSRTAYVLGSGWLVATFYLVLWLLFTDLLSVVGGWLRVPPFNDPASWQHWTSGRFFVGIFLVICMLIGGYYRYQHPSTQVINLVINKPGAVSRAPLRVVAVSDLHLGDHTGKAMLQQYVKQINGLKPDLILIGGDLIDRSVAAVSRQQMQEELNRLEAPLGIYMVPGNHEYYAGIGDVEQFLRKTRIHFLRDSVVHLPGGLTIAGRDDSSNPRRLSLQQLLAGADRESPVLLLDHQPRRMDEAVRAGVDLQFSGHTHNGQIWPFPWLVKRLFELGYGLRHTGNTWQYVSSGLSLWGPPFRIGTRSEAVVFDITFQP